MVYFIVDWLPRFIASKTCIHFFALQISSRRELFAERNTATWGENSLLSITELVKLRHSSFQTRVFGHTPVL